MRLVGKIFLFVTGILLLVSGISSLIPTIKMVVTASLSGQDVPLFIINLFAGLFSVFAGFAGISCLFVATPRRVKRVIGYATVILVLMIVDVVLNIVLQVSNGVALQDIFKGIWSYLLGSGTAIVYMLGALFLNIYYKRH